MNYKTWYEKKADEVNNVWHWLPTVGEGQKIIDAFIELGTGMTWTDICVIREQIWAIREDLAEKPELEQ